VVRRPALALAAGAAGLAADALWGEPPGRFHPVAGFGTAMRRAEAALWRDSRLAGAGYLAVGAALALGAAGLARAGLARATRAAGWSAAVGEAVAAAGCCWLATASRELARAARSVAAALEAGDLEAARQRVVALVGRDTEAMDDKELARAAVESVAENTLDAVVAPVLWAVAAGPRGALAYRAVNTLDAMVGHRSPRYRRFGWASARADDALNWLPARLVPLLVAAARPSRAAATLSAVAQGAGRHPSPNAGYPEAAFAGALGLRLGGLNRYGGRPELRPAMGWGAAPGPADVERAVALSLSVARVLGAGLALGAAALGLAARRGPRGPGG
jgi:adenosylcobinamide-phosphate synthase